MVDDSCMFCIPVHFSIQELCVKLRLMNAIQPRACTMAHVKISWVATNAAVQLD